MAVADIKFFLHNLQLTHKIVSHQSLFYYVLHVLGSYIDEQVGYSSINY